VRRGGPLKRTPLTRIGRKKKSKAGARAALRERVWQRDCQCQFHRYCYNSGISFTPLFRCVDSLDVHEIVPRSVWPDGDLDDSNGVLLCRHHHEWLDSNRELAEQIGLYRRTKP
jgi:hypothetical protein